MTMTEDVAGFAAAFSLRTAPDELLPRVRFTPADLLRWLHGTQHRNERAKQSHAKRRALRRHTI